MSPEATLQGLVLIDGDSGSPVYVCVGSQAIAIGVVSTAGQDFGPMYDTLPGWGGVVFCFFL